MEYKNFNPKEFLSLLSDYALIEVGLNEPRGLTVEQIISKQEKARKIIRHGKAAAYMILELPEIRGWLYEKN